MTHLDRNTSNSSDPRIKGTSIIWGFATGMFALCIPLVGLTRGAAIIPLAIAIGAGTATVAVWRSERQPKHRFSDDQTVRSLKERIANLEAIASRGELDMPHQFKQLELQHDVNSAPHEKQTH